MPGGEEEKGDVDELPPLPIESFLFQYRQVKRDQGNQEVPWKSVENVRARSYTIHGTVIASHTHD